MLKELNVFIKGKNESPAASIKRAKRIHKNGSRSKQGGARQLNDARRLDVAVVLDTMYLLICGTFVFFMHAGFAMLEAGTGRAKNVQAILIKNLIAVSAGTLGWYLL